MRLLPAFKKPGGDRAAHGKLKFPFRGRRHNPEAEYDNRIYGGGSAEDARSVATALKNAELTERLITAGGGRP